MYLMRISCKYLESPVAEKKIFFISELPLMYPGTGIQNIFLYVPTWGEFEGGGPKMSPLSSHDLHLLPFGANVAIPARLLSGAHLSATQTSM
jgi:hypothetical protein